MNFSAKIHDYIQNNHGSREVYPAPFTVFLNADDKTYVEPDISVICDPSKLDDRECNGAPDWIIEVASSGTKRIDYGIKLFKYRSAGVREYWIVNPLTKIVNVFDLEKEELSDQYRFDDNIQVCIYDNLVHRSVCTYASVSPCASSSVPPFFCLSIHALSLSTFSRKSLLSTLRRKHYLFQFFHNAILPLLKTIL